MISVFFFKQKTAYEMRIGDWISDVCSSYLVPWIGGGACMPWLQYLPRAKRLALGLAGALCCAVAVSATAQQYDSADPHPVVDVNSGAVLLMYHRFGEDDLPSTRSEEHTSELHSLMRISYAVFCLKKKKKKS